MGKPRISRELTLEDAIASGRLKVWDGATWIPTQAAKLAVMALDSVAQLRELRRAPARGKAAKREQRLARVVQLHDQVEARAQFVVKEAAVEELLGMSANTYRSLVGEARRRGLLPNS